MTRRAKVPQNAPGEGMIALQTPIAAMLEAGIGIQAYLQLVRDGHLDQARRDYKFSSRAFTVDKMRDKGFPLPDGLPDIEGDVTWRRAQRHWSLDVTMGNLTPRSSTGARSERASRRYDSTACSCPTRSSTTLRDGRSATSSSIRSLRTLISSSSRRRQADRIQI